MIIYIQFWTSKMRCPKSGFYEQGDLQECKENLFYESGEADNIFRLGPESLFEMLKGCKP